MKMTRRRKRYHQYFAIFKINLRPIVKKTLKMRKKKRKIMEVKREGRVKKMMIEE